MKTIMPNKQQQWEIFVYNANSKGNKGLEFSYFLDLFLLFDNFIWDHHIYIITYCVIMNAS